jgi:hypothetical protein
MQRCGCCGLLKSPEDFHPSRRGKFATFCKPCQKERAALRYAKKFGRKVRTLEPPGTRTRKPCLSCGVVKPLEEYSAHRSRPDGHRECCRACDALQRELRSFAMRYMIITQPDLLYVYDRSERRADMAEVGGLKGVHEIRSRLEIARRAKRHACGGELSEETLAELLPA